MPKPLPPHWPWPDTSSEDDTLPDVAYGSLGRGRRRLDSEGYLLDSDGERPDGPDLPTATAATVAATAQRQLLSALNSTALAADTAAEFRAAVTATAAIEAAAATAAIAAATAATAAAAATAATAAASAATAATAVALPFLGDWQAGDEVAMDEKMTRWSNPRQQRSPVDKPDNPGLQLRIHRIYFGTEPETCTCGVELDCTKTCLD